MTNQTTIDKEKQLAEQQQQVAPPPMYQVIMLNDDFTTMDFVIRVLVDVFKKSMDEAERIMLMIHHEGRGICGVYPKDIAATRVAQVHRLAQQEEHPLKCIIEPTSP